MGLYVRRRPRPVEARQYLRNNRMEIADWCGAQPVTSKDGLLLAHVLPSRNAVNAGAAIQIGDWVIRENGEYRVMNGKVFAGLYEEAT